jgi:hypothetical protein
VHQILEGSVHREGDLARPIISALRVVLFNDLAERAAPDFASLRSDARFRQLLAQADKPPAG